MGKQFWLYSELNWEVLAFWISNEKQYSNKQFTKVYDQSAKSNISEEK